MDSYCYICLEVKEDLSKFTPKGIQSSFLVCEDCLEQSIPKWSLQEWQARPAQYIKRKNQPAEKKEQPKEQVKAEAQVQASVIVPQEEQKYQEKNMYIFLEQNVLKYSMQEGTWEGIQLTLDIDEALIPVEEQLSFSLLSTSSACVQTSGLDWVDVVITGGILYPNFTFYGKLNKQADGVNLISGPKLLEGRHQHTMASSEQQVTKRIFTAGGLKMTKGEKHEPCLKIEELNLQKISEWRQIGDLKQARISAAAIVIKETLYIVGGFSLGKKTQNSFFESLNLQTKEQKTLEVKLAQEMSYPQAGFRIVQDAETSNRLLIFGGSEENYAFNCVYSLNVETQNLDFIMYTYNCRADFPIGYLNESKVILVGGAESGGKSEIVDFKNMNSTQLFDYESCLETIPSSQGVLFPDLRWCCYFLK